MDHLRPFCCQHPACPDHGKRGHGNRTVTMRYGPGQARRVLRCRTRRTRSSERKGTPLFDARLPTDRVTAVLAQVAEGVGTRESARLTGVHPDTVTRCIRRAGPHADALHDNLGALSPPDG